MVKLSLTEISLAVVFAAFVVWFSTANVNISLLVGAFAYVIMWASVNSKDKELKEMSDDNREHELWDKIYKLETQIEKCSDSCKNNMSKR